MRKQPEYAERCLDCAQVAIEKFVAGRGLTMQELDLVVASGPSAEVPQALADRLGIPPGRVERPIRELRGAHTAGPIAAPESAWRCGKLEEARRALWVAVGAGITVALALYGR